MYMHDIKRGVGEVQRMYIADFELDIRQSTLESYIACSIEDSRLRLDAYDMTLWSKSSEVGGNRSWTTTDVEDT